MIKSSQPFYFTKDTWEKYQEATKCASTSLWQWKLWILLLLFALWPIKCSSLSWPLSIIITIKTINCFSFSFVLVMCDGIRKFCWSFWCVCDAKENVNAMVQVWLSTIKCKLMRKDQSGWTQTNGGTREADCSRI